MRQTVRSLVLAISFAALGCPVLAAKGADLYADCEKLSDNRLSNAEVLALVHKCSPDAPASEPTNEKSARIDRLQGDSFDDLPDLVPPAGSNSPVANTPIANTPVANSPNPASPSPNHS